MADINQSINNLIGTFATVDTENVNIIPENLVCIDTSNNKIGINTIDPSYCLHIIDPDALKIESSATNTTIIFNNLPISDSGLVTGQIWDDNGTLKIKQ